MLSSREVNFDVSAPGSVTTFNVDAYTTPELNLDRSTLNWKKARKAWPYLNEVPPPAPPNCDIGLLIGMDVVNAHLQRRVISPPEGVDGPHAVQTDLGWCVIGPVPRDFICSSADIVVKEETPPTSCFSIVKPESHPSPSDDLLHRMVCDFFKMEANGIRPSAETLLSADEKRALRHAEATVRHDKEGDCYYVGLPKTHDDATLPNNYPLASTMLQRQLKKFAHQPELAKNFADQMQIYCDRFARKLSPMELRADYPRRNYLIHHGVQHEQKAGSCSSRLQRLFRFPATIAQRDYSTRSKLTQ